tara:strand:+ start:84 stop:974 length:891 start_codon:yes stop_codon:yes gene_type:complete
MRDLKNSLTTSGKNTKNIQQLRSKSFGYQVLGFGAGGSVSYNVATGGTITTDGDFKVHKFTGPGTFEITELGSAGEVDYMIVAGGGGAGYGYGSYAGGGGYRASGYGPSPLQADPAPVAVTTYPIVVGAGGAGRVGLPYTSGDQGSSSSGFSLTAAGGGGGGAGITPGINGIAGGPGGSGGGASGGDPYNTPKAGGIGNVPVVDPVQGHDGMGAVSPSPNAGDGTNLQGGGAIAAGAIPNGSNNGAPNTILGSDVTYSNGGGPTAPPSTPANTGFGGTDQGQTGKSGIVMIRYQFQ